MRGVSKQIGRTVSSPLLFIGLVFTLLVATYLYLIMSNTDKAKIEKEGFRDFLRFRDFTFYDFDYSRDVGDYSPECDACETHILKSSGRAEENNVRGEEIEIRKCAPCRRARLIDLYTPPDRL